MFNLELDDKDLKKIENLFKKTPNLANQILNSALRKAINYVTNEEKNIFKILILLTKIYWEQRD